MTHEETALQHITQAVEYAPFGGDSAPILDIDIERHLTLALVFAVLALNDTIRAASGAVCTCPAGMKYHALNCPVYPGKEQ